MEKFRSAMAAAALRPPTVTLAGAIGEPDDAIDPPAIPMQAPVILPTIG